MFYQQRWRVQSGELYYNNAGTISILQETKTEKNKKRKHVCQPPKQNLSVGGNIIRLCDNEKLGYMVNTKYCRIWTTVVLNIAVCIVETTRVTLLAQQTPTWFFWESIGAFAGPCCLDAYIRWLPRCFFWLECHIILVCMANTLPSFPCIIILTHCPPLSLDLSRWLQFVFTWIKERYISLIELLQ